MYGIQDKVNQILRGAETIRKNQSMLTAQSDSIELYHALCDMTKDLTQKTNEVGRLRELLKKVLNELEKVPFHTPKLTAFTAHRLADRYREELARLAPAPEEPKTSAYSYKCIGNVTKFTHEGNNDAKDKQPEWRELLPDEVIQEGDEVQPKHHDKTKGEWKKAWSFELGVKAGHFKAMRFRTRRPLPKAQEEIPLEADIENLEEIASSVPHGVATQRIAEKTANAIRYLRDEIQKLKEK